MKKLFVLVVLMFSLLNLAFSQELDEDKAKELKQKVEVANALYGKDNFKIGLTQM